MGDTTTAKEKEVTRRIGYVRLSREDAKSMSIENQRRALRAYDPKMPIFEDEGVSGESNLTDPDTAWSKQVRPLFRKDPKGTQIVLFTLDRMSRKKGAMLFEAEQTLDAGGTIYCVRESKTFDDADDAQQAIELLFASYQADAYRVETRKKTKVAIDALKKAGVPLGRKPSLSEEHIEQIKSLRTLGLGYTAIGKAVPTLRKKDKVLVATSPRVIKKVLAGEYESRESYDLRNLEARTKMAARAVLGYREGGGDESESEAAT
ncbi:recombinase family protein [Leucobacter insecticola]|uniref:Recombinase family protein n=1 Tax=Leucobacter insecticola TaxID=2714934 RepID=A0A6G8FIT0_9MICO|nr:recombinase family protein [Leucobacter insecticola]QIM15962.1 recombinase family protein [Leucobacter insecticola]